MNNTKIKICGITRPEDAKLAAELGAWAIGIIFHKGSPRCVTLEQAKNITKNIPKEVLRVGVFVDATLEDMRSMEKEANLDLIQLHGSETDDFCRKLGKQKVIRATTLTEPDRVGEYLLLDRLRKDDAPTGAALDREEAKRIISMRPQTILAGGLTADNVYDSVLATNPFGVDVASGVEASPGIKDISKLKSFFDAVRRADQDKK